MSGLENYKKLTKLGEGTYGVVYKAIDNRDQSFVAIKEMRYDLDEEGLSSSSLREVSIIRDLKHANIIAFREAIFTERSIALVLDYVEYDLRKLLTRCKRDFEPNFIKSIAFQLLAGLYYMHTHRVIHRDLKPENIMINKNGQLMICDFGLSRYFTIPLKQMTDGLITIWYRPPEILLHNPTYDVSVDIWSTACIIAEISRKRPLFMGDSDLDMIQKIIQTLGTPSQETMSQFHDVENGLFAPPEYTSQNLKEVLNSDDSYFVDLISKMLVIDPHKRISAKEALQHEYFSQIPQQLWDMCFPNGF